MAEDLSNYPPTKHGACNMIQDLSPKITDLWKSGVRNQGTDDLVVVVYAKENQIWVDTRTSIQGHIRRLQPGMDILALLERRPETANGTITLWALIEFVSGQVCIMPWAVAHS